MLSPLRSTHAQPHAPALIRSPSHPHTRTNSCSIDNITYFLPTVIWLLNCLQSMSPGNSWASSALFSTPNKGPFPIGPALPFSLFSHQSESLFTGIYSSKWRRAEVRNLHWHLRGHLFDQVLQFSSISLKNREFKLDKNVKIE